MESEAGVSESNSPRDSGIGNAAAFFVETSLGVLNFEQYVVLI